MKMNDWYFFCFIVQKCLKCQWLSCKEMPNVNGLIHQINPISEHWIFPSCTNLEKYREISLEHETVLIDFHEEETKRDFHLRVSTVRRFSFRRNVCLWELSILERFCPLLRVFHLRESLLEVCSLQSGSMLTRNLPKLRNCPTVKSCVYVSGVHPREIFILEVARSVHRGESSILEVTG